MGATASRSSSSAQPTSPASATVKAPSPPPSCAAIKMEYSEARLFTMPEYSKSSRLPPGSTLTLDTFQFRGQGWRVDVDPAGSLACSDALTVSVTVVDDHGWNYPENMETRISIDILEEESGERAAAFDHHHRTQRGKCGGFGFLTVSRTELEAAASCVRDDCLTIRCTLSVDVDVLEPKVGLAGSAQPTGASAKGLHLHPAATVPIVTTANLPVTPSSSALSSPTRRPKCGFRWLNGGRLQRGRLRDAFGVHRYRHVDSSLHDDSESAQTPLLSNVYS